MYYVVERYNMNTNKTDWYVTDYCPKTNQSRECREKGWLGTTNNVSLVAHGGFNTAEEAVVYIEKTRYADETVNITVDEY